MSIVQSGTGEKDCWLVVIGPKPATIYKLTIGGRPWLSADSPPTARFYWDKPRPATPGLFRSYCSVTADLLHRQALALLYYKDTYFCSRKPVETTLTG